MGLKRSLVERLIIRKNENIGIQNSKKTQRKTQILYQIKTRRRWNSRKKDQRFQEVLRKIWLIWKIMLSIVARIEIRQTHRILLLHRVGCIWLCFQEPKIFQKPGAFERTLPWLFERDLLVCLKQEGSDPRNNDRMETPWGTERTNMGKL